MQTCLEKRRKIRPVVSGLVIFWGSKKSNRENDKPRPAGYLPLAFSSILQYTVVRGFARCTSAGPPLASSYCTMNRSPQDVSPLMKAEAAPPSKNLYM